MNLKTRLKRQLLDRYRRWRLERRVPASERLADQDFRQDEFMVRLSFVVPGWLDHRNLRLFDHCLRNLPGNAPVLEIGSFLGLSLIHITHLLRKNGRVNPVFSIDGWNYASTWNYASAPPGTEAPVRPRDQLHQYSGGPEHLIEGSAVTLGDFKSYCIESFRRNIELFSRDRMPHHIALSSDAFFESWASQETKVDFFGTPVALGGPLSFAYIDGDHSHAQSHRDFVNVDRFLDVGGFIVFDDSAEGAVSLHGRPWGSAETAREVAGLSRYRVVDRTHNYCVQKIRG
jgi:predicted O-methyltransferase YrrM